MLELDLTPDKISGQQFYYGKGCDYCNNTGYRGRMGIFEIMTLDDEMREDIIQRASTNILREKALKRGMISLRESGIRAVFEGLTTLEEVVKETIIEEI